ncbi:MAG: DUF2273 domain-containing protein [Clostridium sp.]|nr:DUF2273 domain-containing protein [Clostridium sp.]
MDIKQVVDFYRAHCGEINGAFIGFIIAISILIIGFMQTIFISACILFGYYIGKKLSKDKNYLRNLLDKFLPPGTYR